MCTKVQVDEGAIKRVMGGADIMCRGLTSPGGNLDNDFAPDTIVVRLCRLNGPFSLLYTSLLTCAIGSW